MRIRIDTAGAEPVKQRIVTGAQAKVASRNGRRRTRVSLIHSMYPNRS